jgi:hypothetical protein
MRKLIKRTALTMTLLSCLLLGGCSGNVGIGLSVGVPVGSHGYMRVGSSRLY